jgi:hypothetical protein
MLIIPAETFRKRVVGSRSGIRIAIRNRESLLSPTVAQRSLFWVINSTSQREDFPNHVLHILHLLSIPLINTQTLCHDLGELSHSIRKQRLRRIVLFLKVRI